MAKEFGYSPISIVAAVCGTIATATAALNPTTAPYAVGIGTAATAIIGGTELKDKEQDIKEKIDNALDRAWCTIDKKYRLSSNSEECLFELQREMMGESTSAEEINRNLKDNKIENSLSFVIKNILGKHIEMLNKDPEIIWNEAFLDDAAQDIAAILVNALRIVFENVDHLMLLKVIADSTVTIVREINELGDRLIEEIQNQKQAPFIVPFALTAIPSAVDLVGRDEDVKEIYNFLEDNNIVSIHAYGGVGKTAVALRIINEIKQDVVFKDSSYEHVAWINSTGDLKSDLTGLNIPSLSEKKTQEEKYREISTFLQGVSTFLVIDNIDKPLSNEELDGLNTISGQTKILIAARAYIQNVKEYSLNELAHEDALLLFYRHFTRKKLTIDKIRKRNDCNFAEKIVQAATHNALLVELIGKMAYVEHKKLEWLWGKLCKDIFDVNSKYPVFTSHGNDGTLLEHIHKLYNMSDLTERQKEIMSFIALFPAEYSVFFDVFAWAGFEDDEQDNLGVLQDRGWIVRDDEGYLIHNMVKGSVNQQQEKVGFDECRFEKLIKELSNTDQYMPLDMEYTKAKERIIIPETICGLLADNGSKERNTVRLFNNIASVYRVRGCFVKAIKYYEKALEMFKQVLGPMHPDTGVIFLNMANSFCEYGNYEEALKYSKKALSIYFQLLGRAHPYTAKAYSSIALILFYQGKFEDALDYYLKAMEIQEKVLGLRDLDTALTYNNIALVYYNQVNNGEALKYYGKALEVYEQVLGPEHPSTAVTYNSMAVVYSNQSNYSVALEYYEKALAIRKKVLGPDHPYTARTIGNIALLYHNIGNNTKAMENCKRAIEIQEKVYEDRHPDLATTYNNMALIYHAIGDNEEALEYYEKALAIYEPVLGKEHPDTATIYSNIGLLLADMHDYEKAKSYLEESFEVDVKTFGKEHPRTRQVKRTLEKIKRMRSI